MSTDRETLIRKEIDPGKRDLILVLLVTLTCLVLAHVSEINESWHDWAMLHEDLELDEIPFGLAIASLGFAWYARRRGKHARSQAARSTAANGALTAEIARRQETEHALAAAKDHAERVAEEAHQANLAKSQFLATISHEIRTPMNGVLGMAGLLLDSQLDADQRHQANAIHVSGEALLDLINDILDLAKVEAGKLDLECVDFSLPDVVDGVVELLAPRAHGKGIEIACCIDAEVPVLLHGDPGRIRQILLNLVGNAIKFTETGGVTMAIALEAVDKDISRIRFEVADSGIGIPAQARDRLFKNFSQVDGSTTRRFGGTGLGLAICRELVALMGGEIGFDSSEGEGSRFHVSLPLRNLNGTNRESQAALADALAGQRVLVVDDTAINREIWQRSLMSFGLESDVEPDGPGALRAVMATPYDIVIVDHMMPGMDGLAVAEAIRRLDMEKQPLLVLSSSSGLATTHTEAARLGFDASIPKPLRRATVTAGLQALVRRTLRQPEEAHGTATTARNLSTSDPDSSMLTEGRVLLAEDNAINQLFVTMTLRKAGYRVDVASNGSDAIDLFHKLPYDVVLMDMQMPEMDGMEATRRIRARHADRPTPIIALTANAMKGDRERCLEAGMNDYLAKPLNGIELVEKIQHWQAVDHDVQPTTASATD